MQWFEITIKTTSEAIDLLGAKLTSIGYDNFIIDDAVDFQSFLEQNAQYWDYVDESLAQQMSTLSQIRLYIPADSAAADQIATLKTELQIFRRCIACDPGPLDLAITPLQDEDWENNWKQYYQPISIGKRILVVPEWIETGLPENRVKVLLDPGMIFGTGAHASTQMCLESLEEHICGGETVIDLGSGSGILSITALLLGAASATGIDIDPKAEDIARENASLNNLYAPEFRAMTGNVLSDNELITSIKLSEGYDIVLANIVADVIIPLASVVPSLMKRTGVFICSGILNTRVHEVIAALKAAGLSVTYSKEKNDWYCLTAVLGDI